jgi:hypothetical protein
LDLSKTDNINFSQDSMLAVENNIRLSPEGNYEENETANSENLEETVLEESIIALVEGGLSNLGPSPDDQGQVYQKLSITVS